MLKYAYFILWFSCGFFVKCAVGRDCKKNQNVDWFNPENVYSCPYDKTCCIEGGQPSCCGNKPMDDQVLDQVKLWGIVIGAAIAVGLLICCCRRDNNCCNEDATCKYYLKCGCCCGNRNRHDDVSYQKFPTPSPSTNSLYPSTKASTLSINHIDNVKLVSPLKSKEEAQLQSEKLTQHLA